MSEQTQRKWTSFYYSLIGFGAGAIVGSTMALLLAPASGRETSAAIKGKWDDVSDKAGEMYGGAMDAVSNACEKTAAVIDKAKDILSRKKDVEES